MTNVLVRLNSFFTVLIYWFCLFFSTNVFLLYNRIIVNTIKLCGEVFYRSSYRNENPTENRGDLMQEYETFY